MKRATLGDLTNISWDELNRKSAPELRNIVRNAGDALNKRIKRGMEYDEGESSPAIRKWQEAGGKYFSTKGIKTAKQGNANERNELLKEASRAKRFAQMKTSTVKGTKQNEAKVYAKLNVKPKTKEEKKAFWKGYREMEKRAMDKGFFYESNGMITAYGNTTDTEIENKVMELEKVDIGNETYFVNDKSGELMTYEQATEYAQLELVSEKAEAIMVESAEQQALRDISFMGPSLGGN